MLRGRPHRSLCWDALHREATSNIHEGVFCIYRTKMEETLVALTPWVVGCRSGAERPGAHRSGACCRGSWTQGPLEKHLHLLSRGCSPSHPVNKVWVSASACVVELRSLAFLIFDYFYLSIFNARDAETMAEMKGDMNKLQTVDPSASLLLGYITLSHPGDMFVLPQQ